MAIGTRESGQFRDQSAPEFTTRPRRLLMVGRIQPGREGEVLDAHAGLPIEAAAAAGIDAVEAFLGSGHYALMLEIDGDDAQEALAAYLNDARVKDFHRTLQPIVTGFPSPDARYGPSDAFHAGGSADLRSGVYSSADLPLAASMFRWHGREGR